MKAVYIAIFLLAFACESAEPAGPVPEGEITLLAIQPSGDATSMTDEPFPVPVWYGLQGSSMAQLTVRADHLAGHGVDFNCWIETESWSSPGMNLKFNLPEQVVAGETFQTLIIVLDDVWEDEELEATAGCAIITQDYTQTVTHEITLIPVEEPMF
jgi:hypothetical protein